MRLFVFAYAELLEGQGRFLTPFSETLSALCDAPTWVLSAHDHSLANLEGRSVSIDLASAHRAWQVAELTAAFGDALPKALRAKAIAAVRARAIAPYLRMAETGRYAWWAHSDANWNPVCHAGVVGAALALPGTTASERARIVAAAKAKMRRYLGGFTADGWTHEGVGYWNYGFGNFAALAETVRRATQGREDWLLWPEAHAPALTVPSVRMCSNHWPVLADCAADTAADPLLADFLARSLGAPAPGRPALTGALPFPFAFLFAAQGEAPSPRPLPPHTWLPEAQLLVGRAPTMTFFANGGNNGTSHNHNDVGTFGFTIGGVPVVADLGGESYTSRTFTSNRYQGPLISSFGHAVPRPAETLQSAGKAAAATVLAAEFGDEGRIRLVLDLRAVYRVPWLKTLTREFLWEPALPALTVTDRFAFDEPRPFETALTGWGNCRRDGKDSLQIDFGGQTAIADVSASAAWSLGVVELPGEKMVDRPCAWMDWTLLEDGTLSGGPGKAFVNATAHRFALTFDTPAKEGFISLRFRPAATLPPHPSVRPAARP